MKKLLSIMFALAILMSACKKNSEQQTINESMEVKFTSNIAKIGTRVSGTTWDAGDVAGIYMLKVDDPSTPSHIYYNLAENAPYTASAGATANFTPAGKPLFYPSDGSNVRFAAYYPYTAAVMKESNIYRLPVDVSDQSNLSAIDVLFAQPMTPYYNKNATAPVPLQFDHKMFKVVFNITNGESVAEPVANGIDVTISNVYTKGYLSLNDGKVEADLESKIGFVATSSSGSGTTVTAEAILIPTDNTSSVSITFTNAAGQQFTSSWLGAEWAMAAGYMCVIDVTLESSRASFSGTITPWNTYSPTGMTAEEEPNNDITGTFAQAYYPTDDVIVVHYAGYNPWGNDDNTNFADGSSLQSEVWTVGGSPMIVRFYINFDLSGYNNTKSTLIKNTSLYLYGHPTFEDHSSNTPTNQIVFNRVVGDWSEATLTWNNQPDVDETTSVVSDHIPGTLYEPRKDDYVFNLNNILLKNGKLIADYKGISCRPYQEDINDYYRRVTFANSDLGDEARIPTLKMEYTFPLPEIKFENKVFSLTNNEDLKALFENVQYVWTINGKVKTGESVYFGNFGSYTVQLQIIITNNVGEIKEYSINRTF